MHETYRYVGQWLLAIPIILGMFVFSGWVFCIFWLGSKWKGRLVLVVAALWLSAEIFCIVMMNRNN